MTNREYVLRQISYRKVLAYRRQGKILRIEIPGKAKVGNRFMTGIWNTTIDFKSFPIRKDKEFYPTKIFGTKNSFWMETHSYISLEAESVKLIPVR